MKIALGLEYDGSCFSGWQTQPSGAGVQDAVERALSGIAGTPVTVTGAGRTDAGVHALGQVAHFEVDVVRSDSAWVRGGNAALPPGVAVLWAQPVSDEFHARYRAIERCYRYLLLNRPVRSALHAGRVGWFHAPLELAPMREAAALLLGRHDFSAFRSAECQARTAVRELRGIEVERRGDLVVFELRADAFLHRMVRNIVGCLVYVGKGKYPPAWLGEVLASRDRARAAPTFAPDGLYLAEVRYDEKWQLPRNSRGTPEFW